jgi:heat shock protein HtpX
MNEYSINHRWNKQKLKNGLHTLLLLTCGLLLSGLVGGLFAGVTGMVWVGMAIAVSLAVSPRLSPRFMMRWFAARPLAPFNAPSLHAKLRELARRAGLPHTPLLYYVPTQKLSAFTTGSKNDAAIAVTDGLLRALSSRELTAVMAHEISHLKNNDLWTMNVAATFSRMTSILSAVGQLLLILNLPLILLSGHHFPWIGILVLMVAPTLAMILQMALSRTREFDADLGAATLTGDPQGLASALLKIERYQRGWMGRLRWLGRSGPYDSILNTHPATRDRVNRLIALEQNTPLDRSMPYHRHEAASGFYGWPNRIANLTG